MTADVSLQGISKSFKDITALTDIRLDIDAGEFIVLLGPSGCGKSTLLSIIGGFITPSAGRVVIGGKDMNGVPAAARPTTTMFQDYALFPHMTLSDNVAFGLRMRKVGRRERTRKAHEFLDMVGLKASANRKPHELSGGQRQRVALARALAVDPDLLLLDEPLGALDMKLRRQMQDELKSIQKDIGTTFIHVTHDQEEAMAIADRIVVMNQGVIEDFGKPAKIYMQPESIFAAGFMGEANFIPAKIIAALNNAYQLETMLGVIRVPLASFMYQTPRVLDEVTLCIRPEQLHVDSANAERLSLCQASVVSGAFVGAHYRCQLAIETVPDIKLVAFLSQSIQLDTGDKIEVFVNQTDIIALPNL